MQHKYKILLVILLMVIVILLFIRLMDNHTDSKKIVIPKVDPSGIPVEAVIIRPGHLEDNLYLTGSLLSNEEVELKNEAAGRITHIYFREGQPVKKGMLLVKINDEDLQAQLEKTNIDIELAASDEFRKRNLLALKGVSQEDYDQALNKLNSLKADAELIRAQIAKTEIYAPFDGVIGLRNVSEGSYVAVSTPIASLEMYDPIKIEFSVPEKYMSYIRNGNPVEFSIEGKNKTYTASIYAFEPKIDLDTRTARVRAICRNTDNLIPGSFVKIKLPLQKLDDALIVPPQSIVPDVNKDFVFQFKNGKAKKANIVTGIRKDTSVQITEGLRPGDTILTTGLLQVRDGSGIVIRKLTVY